MAAQSNITLVLDFAGEGNGVMPRLGRLYCPNDTLSTVAGAGYLDGYLASQGMNLLASDFVFAVASNGHQVYKPVFTAGSCQLTVLP